MNILKYYKQLKYNEEDFEKFKCIIEVTVKKELDKNKYVYTNLDKHYVISNKLLKFSYKNFKIYRIGLLIEKEDTIRFLIKYSNRLRLEFDMKI